ncbi:MAG: Rne/Rng family ribonuclease [Magnetococcus sp. DMHC-1]|nr:Rne/Rng family ribonuclease [Magnetococcales bacterium]
MNKRMLVDATHPEEIRVGIVQDQRLIDLDIETSTKEQIKGNIYLGRVTRVEPALQAAFVDFNGGRQGFLSVNDIHPKYYPPPEGKEKPEKARDKDKDKDKDKEKDVDPAELLDEGEEHENGDETDEEVPTRVRRAANRRRILPIQKILTRGQSLLLQVVKEARGNKGASLTTNLSLAGRYTVLLPDNSGGGGGISRKIVDPQERKHLKELMGSLEVPTDVSLIIRTAGLGRTKREITRDMNYLLRLWKRIQEKSAQAKPPCLIHEEGDLILRTIRDLYTTDMTEILIHGQEAYRRGKDFMRLLMPRYVKVVQPYRENKPIFAQFQVENQIEMMHERVIPLKAGGYLVIEATEALVSIDINSGRATREKDVESTAFKTNLQAADEIARQLRLRDLGGLIVIDFIDMEDKKHNTEVEKRIKDAFKLDRAKSQIGRISQFGLLELSRQRLKPAFSESNRTLCPRCEGLGTIRSVESMAIHVLRLIVEEAATNRFQRLTYHVPPDVANYLFNHKRAQIISLEETHHLTIVILSDQGIQTPNFRKETVERQGGENEIIQAAAKEKAAEQAKSEPDDDDGDDSLDEDDEEFIRDEDDEDDEDEGPGDGEFPARGGSRTSRETARSGNAAPSEQANGEKSGDKKRRRRRRRRKTTSAANGAAVSPVAPDAESSLQTTSVTSVPEGTEGTGVPGLYRLTGDPAAKSDEHPVEPEGDTPSATPQKPRRRRRRRRSGRGLGEKLFPRHETGESPEGDQAEHYHEDPERGSPEQRYHEDPERDSPEQHHEDPERGSPEQRYHEDPERDSPEQHHEDPERGSPEQQHHEDPERGGADCPQPMDDVQK